MKWACFSFILPLSPCLVGAEFGSELRKTYRAKHKKWLKLQEQRQQQEQQEEEQQTQASSSSSSSSSTKLRTRKQQEKFHSEQQAEEESHYALTDLSFGNEVYPIRISFEGLAETHTDDLPPLPVLPYASHMDWNNPKLEAPQYHCQCKGKCDSDKCACITQNGGYHLIYRMDDSTPTAR